MTTGLGRDVTLDNDYLEKLDEWHARDLLDTILHESLHAGEPLKYYMLPPNSKKYQRWHEQVRKDAAELTDHAIDEFHRQRSLCPCED